MEPEPGKKRLPFYRTPDNVRTSADIIREAKNLLFHPEVRALNTRRPETPQDEGRRLFRQSSARDLTTRPPSTFSLGARHFEAESRPCSGTRLTPLDYKPRISSADSGVGIDAELRMAPKPPPDPNRLVRRAGSRPRLYQQLSSTPTDPTSPLAFDVETFRLKSESLTDVSDLNAGLSARQTSPESTRRVHSGPIERTRSSEVDKFTHRSTNQKSSPASGDCPSLVGTSSKNGRAAEKHEEGISGAAAHGATRSQTNVKSTERVNSSGRRDNSVRDGSAGRRESGTRDGSAGRRESGTRDGSAGRRENSGTSSRNGEKRVSSGGQVNRIGRENSGLDGGELIEESSYYTNKVAPVLDELTAYVYGDCIKGATKEKNTERLVELSCQLYTVLHDGRMLGRACPWRPTILKTVFKLLDQESPRLLLKLARLILSLKVSGTNLLNICKLIFRVSHDSKNDLYFLDDNILELLVDTVRNVDNTACTELFVYCLGSLKFLSGNSSVAKRLASKQHLSSLSAVLSTVSKTIVEAGSSSEQNDILLQLTATLRNLADVSGTRRLFLTLGVVSELCKLMSLSHQDPDLMLNVSRIFSKLTVHNDCCQVMAADVENFRSFMILLQNHQKREDLVLRICFILGNLTAKHDEAREFLFSQPNALDTLLAVFTFYSQRDIALTEDSSEAASRAQKKVEDVLVKLIRVIANVSISPEIGQQVACSDALVTLLVKILEYKEVSSSEELVLNAIATINNLSYYSVTDSAITRKRLPIAECLLKFIAVQHVDSLSEATRVLGNLTRERNVRDLLVKNKIDEAIVSMLDSENRELVFAACGVLINLMVDEEKRPMLLTHNGVSKLIDVLQEMGRSDWQLAGMVCQTLWNYSSKITSSNACFGAEDATLLADVLTEFLDEESVLSENDEMKDYYLATWQSDFFPVASDLLARIDAHQSQLEPLKRRP